ncbi:hypothetical protein PAXRUDRAFT_17739 [Paxillus rubicundulus Ve08.2h10]|uniref:Uncharacterized protein n=1 Tax=Paxillus rubicundulus Ve08.2h10 TaxID=930991 RepID=A0A0D0DGM7_9AGAM|nr:hypothetical protein PAXRUDRAFT_17739 [Paxillus rubicundulus Ve08.2h10]
MHRRRDSHSTQPTTTTVKKHSDKCQKGLQSTEMAPHAKQQHCSPSQEVLPAGDLDSIPELDEPYNFTAYNVDAAGFPHPSQLRDMTEFLSSFTGSGESDAEVNRYETKSQEGFDLGSLTSMDEETRSDSESSDTDIKMTQPL